MKDWREVGDMLFAEIFAEWEKFTLTLLQGGRSADLNVPGLQINLEPTERPRSDFADAVREFGAGNSGLLVDYLRSDRPIGEQERYHLSLSLEKTDKRPSHRPVDFAVRLACSLASSLYDAWRARNKSMHVSSHGHASDMKDAAANFITDLLWGGDDIMEARIRDLMDRHKVRRHTTDGGMASFALGFAARIASERDAYQDLLQALKSDQK